MNILKHRKEKFSKEEDNADRSSEKKKTIQLQLVAHTSNSTILEVEAEGFQVGASCAMSERRKEISTGQEISGVLVVLHNSHVSPPYAE